MGKYRLDELLVIKKLVDSRVKAQKLILDGKVLVEGKVLYKPAQKFDINTNINVIQEEEFVSRGGYKLKAALDEFSKIGLRVDDKVCLDIGASTGGFTDCLLKHGAKLVIALDNGKNQLHPKLLNNPNVINIEEFNARNLEKLFENKILQEILNKIEIITIDVSFISCTLITQSISKIKFGKPIHIVILIKPNFELQKNELKFLKKGVLKDNKKMFSVLLRTLRTIRKQGFKFIKVIKSPIKGDKGNVEFLVYYIKEV